MVDQIVCIIMFYGVLGKLVAFLYTIQMFEV